MNHLWKNLILTVGLASPIACGASGAPPDPVPTKDVALTSSSQELARDAASFHPAHGRQAPEGR